MKTINKTKNAKLNRLMSMVSESLPANYKMVTLSSGGFLVQAAFYSKRDPSGRFCSKGR